MIKNKVYKYKHTQWVVKKIPRYKKSFKDHTQQKHIINHSLASHNFCRLLSCLLMFLGSLYCKQYEPMFHRVLSW